MACLVEAISTPEKGHRKRRERFHPEAFDRADRPVGVPIGLRGGQLGTCTGASRTSRREDFREATRRVQ